MKSNVAANAADFGQKQHRRIEFRPPSNPQNGFQNGLSVSDHKTKATSAQKSDKNKDDADGISGPTPGLFAPSMVSKYMDWKTISRAGPGLFNHGNTCFLNSTLQCLLHTPALSQVLVNESKIVLSGSERDDKQQKTMLQLFQRCEFKNI
jgi:ubiquitin C-terminal hydrolase